MKNWEVMKAHEEGAEIEAYIEGKWRICNNPVWDWHIFEYRVAKTEREKLFEKIKGKKMVHKNFTKGDYFVPLENRGGRFYGTNPYGVTDSWHFSDMSHWTEYKEPEYTPWDGDTFPDVPFVIGDLTYKATSWTQDHVFFMGNKFVEESQSWQWLLDNAKQRDGLPCGVKA